MWGWAFQPHTILFNFLEGRTMTEVKCHCGCPLIEDTEGQKYIQGGKARAVRCSVCPATFIRLSSGDHLTNNGESYIADETGTLVPYEPGMQVGENCLFCGVKLATGVNRSQTSPAYCVEHGPDENEEPDREYDFREATDPSGESFHRMHEDGDKPVETATVWADGGSAICHVVAIDATGHIRCPNCGKPSVEYVSRNYEGAGTKTGWKCSCGLLWVDHDDAFVPDLGGEG